MSLSQEEDAFEDLIVDHAKAAQIKEQGNSIHEIFNVVIEYGRACSPGTISIYGDLQNRTWAKNYIMAIASPEKTENISFSELLSNKIKQSAHFMSSMIRQYQCSIEIVREPVLKLVVQGAAPKVAELMASIKKELNEMSPNPDASNASAGHLDEEDDVTWIRDPYEMFNDPAKAKPVDAGSPAVTPKNTAAAATTTVLAINETACEDLDHLKGVNINQAPSASTPAMNGQLPTLRHIVIDGSNIAREHGKGFWNNKAFSARGIKIAVDYFRARGHDRITAMLPRFRRGTTDIHCPTTNPEILDELENQGFLAYTPSRQVNNKMQIPYDDRLILTTAVHYNAVVVSNDNYRDLARERDDWRIHIERNLLQYTFVGDLFMVAEDPFGRQGPTLDQLLSNRPTSQSQHTFGNENNQQRANRVQHLAMPNFNQFHSQKQKPHGQDNGQFRKKSNTVNQRPSRRPRNHFETWVMYEQLREIFHEQLSEINSMLSRYPHEMDSSVLITRLLGLM